MRNSAFAVDPCPRDLLGKQWLFAHMSSHYRRMWSAQSVVDSAPPASLKARATPRSARRPQTAVDCYEGRGPPAPTPRATSASTGSRPPPGTPQSFLGPPSPALLPLVDADVPVVLQVLQRQSGRPQRSAQWSRSARLSQKPSRADTDPGPCRPAGRPPGSASSRGSRGGGRSSVASASRRQLEHSTSTLRKPHDQEKPSAYYETLKLVPDHGSQRTGPYSKTAQVYSEVFTPRVPHQPQILRTEVPSRLRSSTTYCPPRSKPIQLKNAGHGGQHLRKDVEQTKWTAQSSPPVSSRDSAYNGGISSGGESRGPTPDQKGNRKLSKRSERKVRKKVDHKRPASADVKTRRKFENKLMNKLLEDERNELQEQRRRVVPWNGVNQDDHGDEILCNSQNLHSESHGDESLTENGSPANSESVSDQSVEEDMEEGADEAIEVDVTRDEKGEDSVIKDGSSSAASVKSQSLTSSSVSNKQVSNQRNTEIISRNSSREPLSSSSGSNHGSKSTSQPDRDTPSIPSIKHTTDQQFTNPSEQRSVGTSSSETSKSSLVSQRVVDENKEILSEQTERLTLSKNEIAAVKETEPSIKSQSHTDKSHGTDFHFEKDRNSLFYTRLVHSITEEVVKSFINTNPGLKAVYRDQIEANSHKLDPIRMQQEVDKLHFQLQIPRDQYLQSVTDEGNVENTGTQVKYSPLDSGNLSPLLSEPSEIWSHYIQQNKTLQCKQESALQLANDYELPPKTKGMSFFQSPAILGGGINSVCSTQKTTNADFLASKLWRGEQARTMGNFDKLNSLSPLNLSHKLTDYSKSTDNTLNPINHELLNEKVLATRETTVNNDGSTSPVFSEEFNKAYPKPSALSNVLRGAESFSSSASQYLQQHSDIFSCLSPSIRSSTIFNQMKETPSGRQEEIPDTSGPTADSLPLCVCKEQNCRCASSTLLQSYMQDWQDGKSPAIISNQFNKLESASRCQPSNVTSDALFNQNKVEKSSASKDCRCKTAADTADLGLEKSDDLEVLTIFCKDKKVPGIPELMLQDNSEILQKKYDLLGDFDVKSYKIMKAETLENSLFHSRERIHSLPIGTGINSDILSHLEGLDLGEKNHLS